jgi:hypothetical protein
MKRISLVIAFISCCLWSVAQNVLKAGLVVRNNGDTLKGWIDYGNWRINPRTIDFKKNMEDASFVHYTVGDVQYFAVSGEDAYLRAAVTKDMRPVKTVEISAYTRDSLVRDTVFLRQLVSGTKLSLYQLIDFKEHYYLKEPNSEPVELEYKLYPAEDGNNVERMMGFRDQLKNYLTAASSFSLQRDIEHAAYTEEVLSKIVAGLNGGAGTSISADAGKPKTKVRMFGSLGMELSTLSITGTLEPTVGMHFTGGASPIIVAGVDVLSPRNFNDITFRFELSYAQNEFKGTQNGEAINGVPGDQQEATYEMKQLNISPAVSIMYNFNRTSSIRYYVGAGIAYHFSSYSGNTLTVTDQTNPFYNSSKNNYYDFQKAWPSVFLRAGMEVNRKFDIGVTGDVFGVITKYDFFSLKPRSYSLRVSYFF